MVYSRATTSAMAERPALGFWVFWVVDIFTSSLGERAVACRDALQVVTEDGVAQTFPTKLAKSQASLGVEVDHVRFPDVA